MTRNGSCLCGQTTYEASGLSAEASACHCDMCTRWAGGPWLAVFVKELTWTNDSALRFYTSSAWAERGFCGECGTSLLYRITASGPHHGITSVSMGSLRDRSGLTLTKEWFIDNKPAVYDLAGDARKITESEAMAMFSGD